MLKEKMLDALNEQIQIESQSSNLYLQMSAWCDSKGLDGCAGFLKAHAAEEMGHMQKLFDYINETGSMAIVGAIEAPRSQYESVLEMFQLALGNWASCRSSVLSMMSWVSWSRGQCSYSREMTRSSLPSASNKG